MTQIHSKVLIFVKTRIQWTWENKTNLYWVRSKHLNGIILTYYYHYKWENKMHTVREIHSNKRYTPLPEQLNKNTHHTTIAFNKWRINITCRSMKHYYLVCELCANTCYQWKTNYFENKHDISVHNRFSIKEFSNVHDWFWSKLNML